MMNKLSKIFLLGILLTLVACASKRTVEIGDRSLASPEENQHYLTIHDAFSRHDTNGDGFLDRHEYAQLQQDPAIVRVRRAIAEIVDSGPFMFDEIDENGDEQISLTELTVIIQPLLPPKK